MLVPWFTLSQHISFQGLIGYCIILLSIFFNLRCNIDACIFPLKFKLMVSKFNAKIYCSNLATVSSLLHNFLLYFYRSKLSILRHVCNWTGLVFIFPILSCMLYHWLSVVLKALKISACSSVAFPTNQILRFALHNSEHFKSRLCSYSC